MTSAKQPDISIRLFAVLVVALSACSDPPPPVAQRQLPDEDSRRPVFFRDAELDVGSWDSGALHDRCHVVAPWGPDSWGVEAATFRTSESQSAGISGARVTVQGGEALLHAQEDEGRWGLVRLIQGDMWGGTNCAEVPWVKPAPLSLGEPLFMEFDMRVDVANMTTMFSSWILIGVNMWIGSPTFPLAGADVHGRKPLVLDLMVFHDSNMFAVHDASHEDDSAYHYQTSVATVPLQAWRHVSVDLAAHIDAAFAHFALSDVAAGAQIHQVEFVVEVHNAEATARVRNLSFFADAETDDTRNQHL